VRRLRTLRTLADEQQISPPSPREQQQREMSTAGRQRRGSAPAGAAAAGRRPQAVSRLTADLLLQSDQGVHGRRRLGRLRVHARRAVLVARRNLRRGWAAASDGGAAGIEQGSGGVVTAGRGGLRHARGAAAKRLRGAQRHCHAGGAAPAARGAACAAQRPGGLGGPKAGLGLALARAVALVRLPPQLQAQAPAKAPAPRRGAARAGVCEALQEALAASEPRKARRRVRPKSQRAPDRAPAPARATARARAFFGRRFVLSTSRRRRVAAVSVVREDEHTRSHTQWRMCKRAHAHLPRDCVRRRGARTRSLPPAACLHHQLGGRAHGEAGDGAQRKACHGLKADLGQTRE
jgi:hypothetical protein